MDFLQNFIETLDLKENYVFILDNAAFHKTDIIRDFLRKYESHISVEYIPPYSPELNPIETCWKVTKNAVTKSQHFVSIEAMQEALESFWKTHKFMQDFIGYLCL